MKQFLFRGLAEGLTGRTFTMATNIDDVFSQFPALRDAGTKLKIEGQTISGFRPCDG